MILSTTALMLRTPNLPCTKLDTPQDDASSFTSFFIYAGPHSGSSRRVSELCEVTTGGGWGGRGVADKPVGRVFAEHVAGELVEALQPRRNLAGAVEAGLKKAGRGHGDCVRLRQREDPAVCA